MKRAERVVAHPPALTTTHPRYKGHVMATADLIRPFPDDIDREEFGHWLSGFADGEGCFMLTMTTYHYKGAVTRNPRARFQIILRADDEAILQQIQSYFCVGSLRTYAPTARIRATRPGAKSRSIYEVSVISQLIDRVIPHFDAYPLRSKKARDYPIWRQGVCMIRDVMARPIVGFGGKGGSAPRYYSEERKRFEEMVKEIRDGRSFEGSASRSQPQRSV